MSLFDGKALGATGAVIGFQNLMHILLIVRAAHCLTAAVDGQRTGSRDIEPRCRHKLLFGINFNPATKGNIKFLTIGMRRVPQGGKRLAQNRIRGNEPDHVTKKGVLLNDPGEALYQPFRSIVMTIDKSGELFNLFRIKTQQRPVLLYFNTVNKATRGTVKEILPSIKSTTKEAFGNLISDMFELHEMWIWNKREGTINNAPSNEQRLRTIKILQSMLPLIDDSGHSKIIEVYENELDRIERMVNEYVKTCKDTPPLHLPISGFGDFTFFEYPQRLKDAIDYISELPPALIGLQKYLLS